MLSKLGSGGRGGLRGPPDEDGKGMSPAAHLAVLIIPQCACEYVKPPQFKTTDSLHYNLG